MKKTALYNRHLALGAKMVPFAGFEMPVQYTGVNDEHIAVRENLGVFDVSHMGEFVIKGEKAFDLLQYATSNDVSKLFDGKVQYSCMPNGSGGIVDDLLVYRKSETEYFLVVNASNIEKDWNWLSSVNKAFGAEMIDISDEMSLIAVQGPKAIDAIKGLSDMDLSNMKYYTFESGSFAGKSDIMVSATGYTGSGGFEIYCRNEDAGAIWDAVFSASEAYDVKPAGLAARDTLRLEMGFCLYGNDIDDTTNPIEAGLGWITKFSKEFIDKELLQAEKEEGPSRKLVGFILNDRGIPRQGYAILNADGKKIGHVTSGTMGPSIQKAIGMGYVGKSYSTADTEIFIEVRNKQLSATVCRPPFYKVD